MPDEVSADPATAVFSAWSSAYSEAQVPRPKLREMIDVLENVIVQKGGSARAIASEFHANVFAKETLREIATLDATQELLKRILANVPRWGENVQAVIRGDAPKDSRK